MSKNGDGNERLETE